MYSTYEGREELEDDLYQEDAGSSEGSEVNSELEFQLYSQLHYSSNAGELEEQEGREENTEGQNNHKLGVTEKTADCNGIVEHIRESGKKKGQKRDKKKKKGLKLSSSLFEEVIVIDSGPDVITISEDDTADSEGVCSLKSRRLHSTPAQQGNRTKKRGLDVPVIVDTSSSESDSKKSKSKSESDCSDSSDSDGLENWMILGRGKQDGDQCISLNLEAHSDSSADAEEKEGGWLVSDKDREAQIYNKDRYARIAVQRVPNRYYTGKNVHCRNCNKTGHLSKNCPEPKKLSPCFLCGMPGHMVSECPNRHCNNCGLPGHLYDSCSERAYWHKQCYRCRMTGHFFDDCPEIWRQYHITTKKGPPVKKKGEDSGRSPSYCYNCSRKGHLGHVCTRPRMFNVAYPNSPFINQYDTVENIKRRQHRIELKVKGLEKNGCFPATSHTSVTPGPLKKKQKISHHKSNQQLNNTPHQTTNSHKPSPSHIFFSDSDFKNAIPKTKKYVKNRQEKSAGSGKPWKPKRPVPTSRNPLPPAKLILDEADDFPRGGGKGESMEKSKKKKKIKKAKEVPPKGFRDSRPDHLCWTVTGEMQGSESSGRKKKKKKERNQQNNKNIATPMYPTDENLFIIKQRKHKR
uniref:Zinc finger CCHC domain-containing protein 7 n=1 Tax=Mastacembelus armatus TaxID=205130 RepID=A0A3Q3KTM9_9TELE